MAFVLHNISQEIVKRNKAGRSAREKTTAHTCFYALTGRWNSVKASGISVMKSLRR